jgi:hypothetical protein
LVRSDPAAARWRRRHLRFPARGSSGRRHLDPEAPNGGGAGRSCSSAATSPPASLVIVRAHSPSLARARPSIKADLSCIPAVGVLPAGAVRAGGSGRRVAVRAGGASGEVMIPDGESDGMPPSSNDGSVQFQSDDLEVVEISRPYKTSTTYHRI